MKKLTGFIAILLFSAAALSQDTSSSGRPNMDTGRHTMRTWQNDTLGMYRWNDSGYYRRNRSLFDSAMRIRRRMWNQDSSYFVRGMGDTTWHYKLSNWMRDSMNYERRNWDSSTQWPDANRWNEVYSGQNRNSNQANSLNQNTNDRQNDSMQTAHNNNQDMMRSQDSSHVRKGGLGQKAKTRSQIDSANSSLSDYQPADSSNKGSVTAGKTNTVKDRVYMKNNAVMISKNGVSSKLTKSITLDDGTKVMADGTIKMPDGQTMKLKNGESINLSSKTSKSKTKKS